MAIANLTGSKGKTALVVLSIALSIVIFNSVLNFTGSFDQNNFVKGRVAADFAASSSDSGRGDESNYMLSQDFVRFIQTQPQVKDLSNVYYYHDTSGNIEETAVSYTHRDVYKRQLQLRFP